MEYGIRPVKVGSMPECNREGIAGFKLINLMGSVWKWKQASQLAIGEMRSISNFKVVPPGLELEEWGR